jgi:hypothetical protein
MSEVNPSQKKQLYDDEEILDNNEVKNDGEISDESNNRFNKHRVDGSQSDSDE